ncbi:probable cysteine protease Atg4p [[Candida] railenensis]|uniref:Cysteine protease n=1 Tax=[Candida] railenensis TaxID=45579 RepID=A0A9P0QTW5_9ASCO|nr:probable cysteine protease Atg4p [[Candida] railenensis]
MTSSDNIGRDGSGAPGAGANESIQADSSPVSRVLESNSESSSSSTPSITPMISQLWSNLAERASSSLLSSSVPVSAIHVLGKSYQPEDTVPLNADILSKIWLTYRAGFEPISKAEGGPAPLSFINSMLFNRNISSTISNLHSLTDNDYFTTDVGWGCMIRTSQSLLANALLKAGYGTSSSSSSSSSSGIIDMFLDRSTAPFSLHNFIKVAGESPLQVKPGEWFGPSAASLSIKRLCDSVSDSKVPQVLISESSDLYNDQIQNLLAAGRTVLVLLPIRLGIDNISPYYYSSLFDLLTLPQSVGIAGGKPSSSYYFFGFQDSKLFYLDPHYPQQSNPNSDTESVNYSTYHTTKYSTLDIGGMDPSMMAGFLIKDSEDYQNFTKSLLESKNKIIHFHEQREKERRSSTSQQDISSDDFSLSQVEMAEEDFVQVGEETENGFVDLGDEVTVKEESVHISREEGVDKIDEVVSIAREEAKDGGEGAGEASDLEGDGIKV